ncbi:MAG: hydrogenase maturation nickel metallochaperone HypA [Lachnospiraceae bacterium]|nr:hydrogenase maturation nickel metallochaperone HypA [Lachnospiraceae bacterium]
MHELAITEGIMETALPAAKAGGAKKILEIRLKIGELSGVFPEYIEEYLQVLAKGTIAEGAALKVERIPVSIKCADCTFEGPIDRKNAKCPKCGSLDFRITGGREYYVDSLEVE